MTEAEHEEWGRIYGQGVRLEAIRDYAGAAERYLAAARIDELYADLQFRLGRCYWAQGEYEKARGRYVRARELDTLRFRADDRINEIIRRAGAGKADMGIYLADASRFLERNSLNNTPGEELFHEHVHLNFKGTYLLATAILEQVRKVVPPQPAGRRVLTEEECAVRLPYTGWDRHEAAEKILDGFIRKPPFTNQLYHADQVRRMEQAIDSLKIHIAPAALEEAAAAYRQVIESAPGDWVPHWKYGKLLAEGPRDYQAAAEQYRIVQKLIPHSHLGHTAMGDVSRGLGDIERAVAEYGKAIRLKPTCIEAHYYLGWAYLKQNKPKLAKEYYSKTLRLQPDHVPACDNLAKILYQQGKIDEAIKTYRRGLGFSPNSSVLHGNLGMLLSKKGRGEEAIDELRTALALDPNSDKIRRMLEVVSKSQD